MSFFTSSDITLGTKLLEVVYIVIGLITLYTGVKNARDKENPSRVGTAVFWCALGVVLAFGHWIPPVADGVLVIVMTIPAILGKVKIGRSEAPSEESVNQKYKLIGMKIFAPALSIGVCAILFAIFLPDLGAIVGIGAGIDSGTVVRKPVFVPVAHSSERKKDKHVYPRCFVYRTESGAFGLDGVPQTALYSGIAGTGF